MSACDTIELVSVNEVSFRFGDVNALQDLSFTVSRGERVALLGHNGAGKTTLFRLMLGFLTPDRGTLAIQGLAPGSTEARRLVSYLPENVRFAENLTGMEVLRLYAKLKGAAPADCNSVLEQVGLADVARQRVGSYSKGMRQRLGLAQALLGRPALLLLDEPTSGLDPLSRQDFYALADTVAQQGTAVLQSSHSLTELEARTDRIAILQKGKLVANASLEVLQMSAALPTELIIRPTPGKLADLFKRMPDATINADQLVLACQATDKVAALRQLWALEELVADIQVKEPRLDDVYRFYCAAEGKGHHSVSMDQLQSPDTQATSCATDNTSPGTTVSGERP